MGATFAHNPPDIGIVADFDALGSDVFDAQRVDPLIREFYEHTSRFKLAITPEFAPTKRASSDSNAPYSGHYISAVEDDGALTTLQLVTFGEQIHVYVHHGRLKTEHRFYLGGTVFMTLHYEIERK